MYSYLGLHGFILLCLLLIIAIVNVFHCIYRLFQGQSSRGDVTTTSSRVLPSGGGNPDLLGGFGSTASKASANGDFADFNPRQDEGRASLKWFTIDTRYLCFS